MRFRGWPAWALGAALILLLGGGLAWWGKAVPGRGGPLITLLYTRGLSGLLEPSDLPSPPSDWRTLSDVGIAVEGVRQEVPQAPGPRLVLLDLGGSLRGIGRLNDLQEGRPAAAGLGALGYRAVLPSACDLLPGASVLDAQARQGSFSILLANARGSGTAQHWNRPVVVVDGGLTVAIHGLYFPPEDWEGEAPSDAAAVTFSRSLESFRQALREVPADVRIVVARVRDASALARQLPEASVIIPALPGPVNVPPTLPPSPSPAGGATPGTSSPPDPYIAPSLCSPAFIGRVDVRRRSDHGIEITGSRVALPSAGRPDDRVTRSVRAARQKLVQGFPGKSVPASNRPLACLDAPDGTAPASLSALCAGLVRDELGCDACIISERDAGGTCAGIVTQALIERHVPAEARIRVVELEGTAVQSLVESLLSGAGLPPGGLAGLKTWLGPDGRPVRILQDGVPVGARKRLRVAVSSSVPTASGAPGAPAESRPLRDILLDALSSRPLLEPPRRAWFKTQGPAPDADSLLASGSAHAADGRIGPARAAWVQALALKPDERTAVALLRTMQSSQPSAPPSYRELAELVEQTGYWRQAFETWQLGRLAYPAATAYPLGQARILLHRQMPDEATPFLKSARDSGAPEEELDWLEGWRLLLKSDKAAAAVLQRALRARPADARCRVLAGIALYRGGDEKKAQAIWSPLMKKSRR